ncbi:hypothetical protein RHMOL_Rhmol13G0046000 [Rhododendron molle]|uniref:Uncharacterized protein n=1 Tax=Rhododendron molle TaxID=49168 RepID=A0ACC0L3W0_RHOML|nr:hypothetical protein RHMOL_Rhmol13G0046000 [Rhododendron molle]
MPSVWASVVSSPSSSSSPLIANPLFLNFKVINTYSKNSCRLPSVIVSSSSSSSSASKFPVAKRIQSFLSISSSSCNDWVDHCALLHNSATTITGSFSSRRFSVRDDISSLGKKSLVWAEEEEEEEEEDDDDDDDREEYGRAEDMPQLDALVMVVCTMAEPDFSYPWRREQEHQSYAYGLIMSGRRVLTTAHSVDHHTVLKLVKDNCHTLYTATMLAIAPECGLALLTVNDDEFWMGVKPMEFGDMPSPGDKAIIALSREDRDYVPLMTARVLRLGMTRYLFWGSKLLAFQLNVGSKGAMCSGPAFDERGKCVGLKLQSKDNKSDFIPAEVINHFIQDYDKNGAYTGFPLLGIKWQKMENPDLRVVMKMGHDQQGILITEVKPNYPESMILKPYDVILSIDGININNDGTVPFLRGRRIEFSYLMGKKYSGDSIVIKVRRGSEIHEFIIELATHKQFVPTNIIGRPLRYYIIGGFVFTTLSFPYLQVEDYWNDENETPEEDKLFSKALYEEPVVLCQVLKDEINAGYDTEFLVENQVLVTFNNNSVEGLESLVSMVETCNEDFMKFSFGNHKILVLPTTIAKSRTPDILKAHSVSCAMSDDLKELVKLIRGKESPGEKSEI